MPEKGWLGLVVFCFSLGTLFSFYVRPGVLLGDRPLVVGEGWCGEHPFLADV